MRKRQGPFPSVSWIRSFRKRIFGWYDVSRRDLPWRRTTNPYRIWVSEVMLQQTRVDTVIPYYQQFIKIFPSIAALARADLQDVLGVWEGLGYYARARNLHKAAVEVSGKHHGKVPTDPLVFGKLPGVGKYTEAAVMSIAFAQALPVVDGNVIRVISRLFCLTAPPRSARGRREIYRIANLLLASNDPGRSNQAIMELGATVCSPRTPRCTDCPVSVLCCARKTGTQETYPASSRRKALRHETVAVGLVRDRRGRMLISRRPEHGLLGGLWEFPGGKVIGNEIPADTVVRELREELGVEVKVVGELCRVKHAYTHFKVTLHAFDCLLVEGTPQPLACSEWRWVHPLDLGSFPFPRATRKIIEALDSNKAGVRTKKKAANAKYRFKKQTNVG